MGWDSIQQILRIVLFAGGGYLFGDAAQSDLYQQAAGGVLAIGAFGWWFFWERHRT